MKKELLTEIKRNLILMGLSQDVVEKKILIKESIQTLADDIANAIRKPFKEFFSNTSDVIEGGYGVTTYTYNGKDIKKELYDEISSFIDETNPKKYDELGGTARGYVDDFLKTNNPSITIGSETKKFKTFLYDRDNVKFIDAVTVNNQNLNTIDKIFEDFYNKNIDEENGGNFGDFYKLMKGSEDDKFDLASEYQNKYNEWLKKKNIEIKDKNITQSQSDVFNIDDWKRLASKQEITEVTKIVDEVLVNMDFTDLNKNVENLKILFSLYEKFNNNVPKQDEIKQKVNDILSKMLNEDSKHTTMLKNIMISLDRYIETNETNKNLVHLKKLRDAINGMVTEHPEKGYVVDDAFKKIAEQIKLAKALSIGTTRNNPFFEGFLDAFKSWSKYNIIFRYVVKEPAYLLSKKKLMKDKVNNEEAIKKLKNDMIEYRKNYIRNFLTGSIEGGPIFNTINRLKMPMSPEMKKLFIQGGKRIGKDGKTVILKSWQNPAYYRYFTALGVKTIINFLIFSLIRYLIELRAVRKFSQIDAEDFKYCVRTYFRKNSNDKYINIVNDEEGYKVDTRCSGTSEYLKTYIDAVTYDSTEDIDGQKIRVKVFRDVDEMSMEKGTLIAELGDVIKTRTQLARDVSESGTGIYGDVISTVPLIALFENIYSLYLFLSEENIEDVSKIDELIDTAKKTVDSTGVKSENVAAEVVTAAENAANDTLKLVQPDTTKK